MRLAQDISVLPATECRSSLYLLIPRILKLGVSWNHVSLMDSARRICVDKRLHVNRDDYNSPPFVLSLGGIEGPQVVEKIFRCASSHRDKKCASRSATTS